MVRTKIGLAIVLASFATQVSALTITGTLVVVHQGDTLAMITPTSNGIYICNVTDKSGCLISETFNVTNIPTSILEINSEKRLIKIVDILGRKNKEKHSILLFYIYDDGTVEKIIIIE